MNAEHQASDLAVEGSHPSQHAQRVIVVASGSDPRSRRLNLGHFAAGRWQPTDQPTDRAEVLVSGEGLQRGPVDVLGTLLHEAATASPAAGASRTPAVRAATTARVTVPGWSSRQRMRLGRRLGPV